MEVWTSGQGGVSIVGSGTKGKTASVAGRGQIIEESVGPVYTSPFALAQGSLPRVG